VTSSGIYCNKGAQANMLITVTILKTWIVKIHNIFKLYKIDRNVDLRHSDVLQYTNPELNSICHLLALLGARHILHIRVRPGCQRSACTRPSPSPLT